MPILGYERSVMYRSVFILTAQLHTDDWIFVQWLTMEGCKPCKVAKLTSMAVPGTYESQTHTKTCLL